MGQWADAECPQAAIHQLVAVAPGVPFGDEASGAIRLGQHRQLVQGAKGIAPGGDQRNG